MKHWRILFGNLRRKKIRTILTVGSFAVAMFLFGILVVVRGAFSGGVEIAGVDRLIIINRISIIQPMPLSYRERILQVPGVKHVTFSNWFGGVYQDEKNFFPIFCIDTDSWLTVFNEFQIPPDQWKAFQEDREGAIVGEDLVKRFGWKIGDRVPIKGTIFSGTWEFNIRGIYKGTRQQDDPTQFWFHWKYFDERKEFQNGMAGWYTLRIDSPDNAVKIAKSIDATFANSAYETKTETERAFAANWVKQMGNIEFMILSIGTVVMFTLLLVTGNTMAISVRERIRDLAVLKAIGYSDRTILTLVMLESVLIAALGGSLGLAAAKGFSMLGDPTGGLLPIFYLPPIWMLYGFAGALLIGSFAGVIPAFSAMRLRVVEALRRV
jgi:putative ABC transport system permease protein